MKYKCSYCNQEHDVWPALGYSSPAHFDELSEKEKKEIAELSSDYCTISHPDTKDRFIRCTLTQKVIDHCENLEYGIWVSLSEESFRDYADHFNDENHLTRYFGWFSTRLPDYEDMLCIPTTVITRAGHKRPEVIPHEDFDHPFVNDYYKGITKAEAEKRINDMLKITDWFKN